eukprot:UN34221
MHPDLRNSEMSSLWLNYNLFDCSTQINFVMDNPLSVYLTVNFKKVMQMFVDITSRIKYIVGFNIVDTHLGILDYFHARKNFSMFMNLFLNLIITILLVLASIVIY